MFRSHLVTASPFLASAMLMEASWAIQASRSPSWEKLTPWTQPPPIGELLNSAINCPIGIFLPHGVSLGLSSMSLMKPENTLTLKSVEPHAKRTLLGCQSREVTVDFSGFLMCLATHLKEKVRRTRYQIPELDNESPTRRTRIWLPDTRYQN